MTISKTSLLDGNLPKVNVSRSMKSMLSRLLHPEERVIRGLAIAKISRGRMFTNMGQCGLDDRARLAHSQSIAV